MTKLDAVNRILRLNGLQPVSGLDTNGPSAAANAERVLDQVSIDIQSQGWVFNTRKDVTLERDGSNNIPLPDDVIHLDSDTDDFYRNVTQVGGYLYDLDDNTDEFTADVKVTYVINYSFGCIPYPVQRYIACKAASQFNAAYCDAKYVPNIERELAVSKGDATAFNERTHDANLFAHRDARRMLGNRAPNYLADLP